MKTIPVSFVVAVALGLFMAWCTAVPKSFSGENISGGATCDCSGDRTEFCKTLCKRDVGDNEVPRCIPDAVHTGKCEKFDEFPCTSNCKPDKQDCK